MTGWRPKEGWVNPYNEVNKTSSKYYGGNPFDAVEEAAFEAGADALLKALRKEQKIIRMRPTCRFDLCITGQGADQGTLVYIPDDIASPCENSQETCVSDVAESTQ